MPPNNGGLKKSGTKNAIILVAYSSMPPVVISVVQVLSNWLIAVRGDANEGFVHHPPALSMKIYTATRYWSGAIPDTFPVRSSWLPQGGIWVNVIEGLCTTCWKVVSAFPGHSPWSNRIWIISRSVANLFSIILLDFLRLHFFIQELLFPTLYDPF